MSKSVQLPDPAAKSSNVRARGPKLARFLAGFLVVSLIWLSWPWRGHKPVQRAGRGEIDWHKCSEGVASVFECGTLIAPLDYTNLDDSRDATIGVIRYKAGGGKTPRDEVLGSVLFNPGGPGGSGIQLLAHEEGTPANYTVAHHFDEILGTKYDLVSFDPRGVGETWPQTTCFSDEHELLYYQLTNSAVGLPGSHSRKAMKHEIGSLLAELQVFGSICSSTEDAELFKYVGTTFVARDMHLLHQALGDPQINYWGFSYGSVLGSTYADMFPESVRRLVIDGVVDVPTYYAGNMRHSMRDTEAEFDHFFKECFESGANSCRLASLASSYEELKKLVLDYSDRLKTHPIPVLHTNPPRVLTYLDFMSVALGSMYSPAAWPRLAESLFEAIGEGRAERLLSPVNLHPSKVTESEAFEAIICGDALSPPAQDNSTSMWSISDYERHSEPMIEDSPHFGHVFANIAPLCEGAWQIRGQESHHGNFTSETSFPLLTIGNDYDPVTPGRYADKMARLFPNAVSVRRDGYGHCSLSQASQCIENVVYNYFVEGLLPSPDTRCPVDVSPFGASESAHSKQAIISEALMQAHL